MISIKKIFTVFVLLLATAGTALFGAERGISSMSGKRLEAIAANKAEKDNYMIIDVREKEEYAEGHVRNAINISVNELKYRLSEIEDLKDKNIITICRSGKRSMKAAEFLYEQGFTRIFNADGVGSYNYNTLTKITTVRGKKLQEFAEVGTHFIIDVREEKDYKAGHAKGAVHIPANAIAARIKEIPASQKIAVYSYKGDASLTVAEKLAAAGYDVTNALDGTQEYNYKLVK